MWGGVIYTVTYGMHIDTYASQQFQCSTGRLGNFVAKIRLICDPALLNSSTWFSTHPGDTRHTHDTQQSPSRRISVHNEKKTVSTSTAGEAAHQLQYGGEHGKEGANHNTTKKKQSTNKPGRSIVMLFRLCNPPRARARGRPNIPFRVGARKSSIVTVCAQPSRWRNK